jgi:UV excision repair protein RAD23
MFISNTDILGHKEHHKSELPAAGMKLIHSGKVLKDGDLLSSYGIRETDFLVVMVTKPKKVVETPKPFKSPAEADTKPSVAAPEPSAAAAAPTAAAPPDIAQGAIDGLIAMGFPEAEVKHCLRAAGGNPDVAVEFLTNGIPDHVETTTRAGVSSGAPLQALRNHPQFNDLRRLVQSNPSMLQQVLTQIGQQQPELLQEINANQALFLQIMNEPITQASAPMSAPVNASNARVGMGSPAEMASMIQGMSAEEVNHTAQMMGITPEQLRQTATMIGSMPPEQLDQFMQQAMGGDDDAANGQQVLRLTEEEMAAVDRLAELGFDRAEAAQAFLACDKNEALAANLLMDSQGDGGAFGFDGGSGGNDDGPGNDDDDNMYD